jgi:hypothetical protein
MRCFSLELIEQVLIWLVVIGAVIAIVRLLLPAVLAQFGGGGSILIAALNILMWAVVLVFVIIVCFYLISCLLSFGAPISLHR